MDYKYIEQLLERYWECQATVEEEAILRAFFSQEDVPASLLKYKDWFVYTHQQSTQEGLTDDFDSKMLAMISEKKTAKARTVSLMTHLRPLLRAAAVIAVIITLSNAIQMAFDSNHTATDVIEAIQGQAYDANVAQNDTLDTDTMCVSQHVDNAEPATINVNSIP